MDLFKEIKPILVNYMAAIGTSPVIFLDCVGKSFLWVLF